jgi:hypothetical protein
VSGSSAVLWEPGYKAQVIESAIVEHLRLEAAGAFDRLSALVVLELRALMAADVIDRAVNEGRIRP